MSQELLAEFKENAHRASFHQATDNGNEWILAKPYEDRCKAIFDAADADLRNAIKEIAGEYLIGSWWRGK